MAHELRLSIHAVPGARNTGVAGAHGGVLRVRLAAPPVDGKANAALLGWAAEVFGLPRSCVRLLQGTASRQKLLALEFDTPVQLAAARQTIDDWMGASGDGVPTG